MYTQYPTYIRREDGAVIPMEIENADFQEFENWVAAGNSPAQPPSPTIERRIADLLIAVDAHLNAPARAKGYDSIRSAALRAGYPGPFHDEGMAFATWMDATYATCYQLLAQWQAGQLEEPRPSELISMLPVLELPRG
jgi:hypothetical protein